MSPRRPLSISLSTVDPFEGGEVGLGLRSPHSASRADHHAREMSYMEVYEAVSLDGGVGGDEETTRSDGRRRERSDTSSTTMPPSGQRTSTILPVISPYSSSSKTSPSNMSMTKSPPPNPLSPTHPISPHRRTIKGKERAWDLDIERGDERPFVELQGQEDAGMETGKVYPPISDEEAEERRIQENLAMFTARDMARRRAARASRQYLSSHTPSSSVSTTHSTGFMGMSLGSLNGSATKRGSMFGFLKLDGGGGGGSEDGERERGRKRDSDLPISTAYRQPFLSSPHPPTQPSNPFDNPYSASQGDESPIPSPTRSTQPNIERQPTPILHPIIEQVPLPHRTFSDSTTSDKPNMRTNDNVLYNPTEDGYRGSSWRGGAATLSSPGVGMDDGHRQKDRWWYALCAWGHDLDDGEDGQAGRTNPFE